MAHLYKARLTVNSHERSARLVLEELTRAYGSALRAAFVVSGMSEKRFASDVLAGRGERTVRRWLTEPGKTPRAVESWARRLELLELDGRGRLTLHLIASPRPRRGRPPNGASAAVVLLLLAPIALVLVSRELPRGLL